MRKLYTLLICPFISFLIFYKGVVAQSTQSLNVQPKHTSAKKQLPNQEPLPTGPTILPVLQEQVHVDPANPPKRFIQDVTIPDFTSKRQLHTVTPVQQINTNNPKR